MCVVCHCSSLENRYRRLFLAVLCLIHAAVLVLSVVPYLLTYTYDISSMVVLLVTENDRSILRLFFLRLFITFTFTLNVKNASLQHTV